MANKLTELEARCMIITHRDAPTKTSHFLAIATKTGRYSGSVVKWTGTTKWATQEEALTEAQQYVNNLTK